jgi:hypothetical protein
MNPVPEQAQAASALLGAGTGQAAQRTRQSLGQEAAEVLKQFNIHGAAGKQIRADIDASRCGGTLPNDFARFPVWAS